MLIFNTTFMMEPDREADFLQWFRTQLPSLTGPDGFAQSEGGIACRATSPRLSALRMAAGQEAGENQAHSVAFQVEFADRDSLLKWADGPLDETATRFMKRFGPNAAFFTSVFETIPL